MSEPQTIEKTPDEPSNTKSALNIKVKSLVNSMDNLND